MCMTSNPIEIRGVNYPSQKAAAKALGLADSTIHSALERGTLGTVGLPHGHGIPTKWRGVEYISRAAAARAEGVCLSTLYKRMKVARHEP